MSVSEVQKLRLRLKKLAKEHKDNPAIATRVHLVSKSVGTLEKEPDRPSLRSQVLANIADLEATLSTTPSPQ